MWIKSTSITVLSHIISSLHLHRLENPLWKAKLMLLFCCCYCNWKCDVTGIFSSAQNWNDYILENRNNCIFIGFSPEGKGNKGKKGKKIRRKEREEENGRGTLRQELSTRGCYSLYSWNQRQIHMMHCIVCVSIWWEMKRGRFSCCCVWLFSSISREEEVTSGSRGHIGVYDFLVLSASHLPS